MALTLPKNLVIDGPGFINPGRPASPTGMQGYGNDMFRPPGATASPAVARPTNLAVDGGSFVAPRPSATAGLPSFGNGPTGMQGYGNDMFYAGGRGITDRRDAGVVDRGSMGLVDRASLGNGGGRSVGGGAAPWTPYMLSQPAAGEAAPANHARGPMLNNEMSHGWATGFHDPNAPNEAGWWHQPNGYIQSNGQSSSFDQPGWWHAPSSAGMTAGGGAGMPVNSMPMLSGGGSGGTPWGNMGGGGGGSGGGWDAWKQAMDAANAANRSRQNNITGGYEAMKKYIGDQFSGLGNQQRKDINTTFDKERGGLTQSMISRGLTNSTVLDNMMGGNERRRGESLARLDDDLTRETVNTTLPVWGKELDFLNSINENGPNMNLMAQLLQNAAAGGGMGGGGGVNVDLSGMGGGYGGFGMPGMMGYGGGWPVGYGGGGSMLADGTKGAGGKMRLKTSYTGNYGSPMVFGPGGSSGGGASFIPGDPDYGDTPAGAGSFMNNFAVPSGGGGMGGMSDWADMADTPASNAEFAKYFYGL